MESSLSGAGAGDDPPRLCILGAFVRRCGHGTDIRPGLKEHLNEDARRDVAADIEVGTKARRKSVMVVCDGGTLEWCRLPSRPTSSQPLNKVSFWKSSWLPPPNWCFQRQYRIAKPKARPLRFLQRLKFPCWRYQIQKWCTTVVLRPNPWTAPILSSVVPLHRDPNKIRCISDLHCPIILLSCLLLLSSKGSNKVGTRGKCSFLGLCLEIQPSIDFTKMKYFYRISVSSVPPYT